MYVKIFFGFFFGWVVCDIKNKSIQMYLFFFLLINVIDIFNLFDIKFDIVIFFILVLCNKYLCDIMLYYISYFLYFG